MGRFDNQQMFKDEGARQGLAELVTACRALGTGLPPDEQARGDLLDELIHRTGAKVRSGALDFRTSKPPAEPVLRLYKGALGKGTLKLQIFSLQHGEAHPPHAHNDLFSLQLVLQGTAAMVEHTVLDRPSPRDLVIGPAAEKTLRLGEGTYTLARRNNVHWQTGIENGTVLLNINWQGLLPAAEVEPSLPAGRTMLDWEARTPEPEPDQWRVSICEDAVSPS